MRNTNWLDTLCLAVAASRRLAQLMRSRSASLLWSSRFGQDVLTRGVLGPGQLGTSEDLLAATVN